MKNGSKDSDQSVKDALEEFYSEYKEDMREIKSGLSSIEKGIKSDLNSIKNKVSNNSVNLACLNAVAIINLFVVIVSLIINW